MVTFENILEHSIPMKDFRLKWRFTDEMHHKLPADHLAQLKPLDKEASQFLWDYIAQTNLHKDTPFQKGFFKQWTKRRF